MSEIDKLYKNAGIKADRIVCYRGFDNCIDNDFNCHCHNEKPCKDAAKIYPPFTAEKQINLILFLANREIRISPTYISSGYYLNNLHKIKSSRNISTFENSLAQHINAIWQDLTPEEKQQVKGILE